MPFLGRGVKWVVKAALRPHQYRGLYDIATGFENPSRVAANYFFRRGTYPSDVVVKTPLGKKVFHLYTVEDLITANEIFARKDYHSDGSAKIVLDFGSNIGISIAYFLTRARDTYVYGYEPVARNVERLRLNLAEFSGRYEIVEKAVSIQAGWVEFGTETTGRYGGIGRGQELRSLGHEVTTFKVECLEANSIIEHVIGKHGRIDVLKIDIEGPEEAILSSIPKRLLGEIGIIYAEGIFPKDLLASTHEMTTRGVVAKFARRLHT